MAKISARGATELDRVKGDYGTEYLLRSDGMILAKVFKGEPWHEHAQLKNHKTTTDAEKRLQFQRWAQALGLSR